VLVEIWSDVVCPWCYVGKRRFEEALQRFEHRDEVAVEWKSFELDPAARAAADTDYVGRLAAKYGRTREQAQQMLDSMTETAASVGLEFHFERAVHANTFAAHQVIHLGAERDSQDGVKERLMRAYFTEGANVGDIETLARLGAEAGLDAAEVRAALADGRYASAVRTDEAEAAELEISGVPFFVVDRRYGISGAQPPDVILEALRRAWAEGRPALVSTGSDGAACGPDGCPI
jgi:predicted DsbA family dithiol-disulfide isomerase